MTPIAGDNLTQIQNAIAQVQAMSGNSEGIRGVVLLKAGLYEVSNTIKITKSGVILRGEGQGEDGTILKATKKYSTHINRSIWCISIDFQGIK